MACSPQPGTLPRRREGALCIAAEWHSPSSHLFNELNAAMSQWVTGNPQLSYGAVVKECHKQLWPLFIYLSP